MLRKLFEFSGSQKVMEKNLILHRRRGGGGGEWGGPREREGEGERRGGGEARNTKKASAIKRYLSKDQSISYWKELSKF